jgi:hypothetical protein
MLAIDGNRADADPAAPCGQTGKRTLAGRCAPQVRADNQHHEGDEKGMYVVKEFRLDAVAAAAYRR